MRKHAASSAAVVSVPSAFRTADRESIRTSYNRVAREYRAFYSKSCSDLADSDAVFSKAIRDARGTRILDVGCGPAIALDWSIAEPDMYLGIDLSDEAITEARRRWPRYEFEVAALEDKRATWGRFGYVLGAFGPLMHVANLERFAQATYELLAPGGRFIVMGATRPREIAILKTAGVGLGVGIAHPPAALRRAFAMFEDVHVRGFRFLVMGPRRVQRIMRSVEMHTVGVLFPSSCEFFVVAGRRC